MISVTFDASEFKMGIITAMKKVERASREGMKDAVRELMGDSFDVPPSCPTRSGAMAASHSTFVDGQLVAVSNRSVTEGGKATPLRSLPKPFPELTGSLVVHKPYATSQHEGISRWGTPYEYRTPGTGRKWIEAKLIRFGKKYYALIAGRIRRAR